MSARLSIATLWVTIALVAVAGLLVTWWSAEATVALSDGSLVTGQEAQAAFAAASQRQYVLGEAGTALLNAALLGTVIASAASGRRWQIEREGVSPGSRP